MSIKNLESDIKKATDGADIDKIVVKHLSEIEIERRAQLIVKGLEKLELLKKTMEEKSRPDVRNFSGTGATVEYFSEKGYQEAKKSKEAYRALEDAISQCLKKNVKASYDNLEKVLNKG